MMGSHLNFKQSTTFEWLLNADTKDFLNEMYHLNEIHLNECTI